DSYRSSLPRHPPRPSRFPYTTLFRSMAMERFNKLETAKVVITNGNHDQTSVVSNHRTPIDAYIGSQPFCFHAAGATEYVEHDGRSEEHTSELQSRFDLVCRLLLEKKK